MDTENVQCAGARYLVRNSYLHSIYNAQSHNITVYTSKQYINIIKRNVANENVYYLEKIKVSPAQRSQ
jgi:hypothetical protein